MFKILIVLKKLNFMGNNDIITTHLRYSFAELYLCELNILLTFHYLNYKSEHDFNMK